MKLFTFLLGLILISFSANCQIIPWLSKEVNTGAHDPTIFKDSRGVYSLLTTNNMLQLRQSDNMTNWRIAGNIISKIPAYMTGVQDIWAPHITFRNGRYWVYYCGSSFGTNNSWIALASSPTLDPSAPDYSWTDHGEVIHSTSSNNYNCIDPEMIIDNNEKVWLSFGSFWTGIKMIAIDPATGKQLSSDKTIYSLANRGGSGIEGPSILSNKGYYFLFTAWDKCCDGINSTYRTMVGRSQTVNGTYTDKTGKNLASGGGTQLLSSYGRYFGPGGGSVFRDGRRTYFTHHYYNGNQNGSPTLEIREVVFDNDNWPIITQPFLGRRQSFEAEHAQRTGVGIATSVQASNGEYVNGIDATDSRLVFHINALQAGQYMLRIRFSSPSAPSSHFLKTNNSPETEILYPASPASIDFPESRCILQQVTLNEGYNQITFRKGIGTALLDRIDLIRNADRTIEAGSFDQSKVVEYLELNNNANFSNEDWAQFENIDFGQGNYDQFLCSFYGNCNGQLKINIDASGGPINSSNAISINNATSDYVISLPSALTSLKGIHDVYLSYTGPGECLLDQFKFAKSNVLSAVQASTFILNSVNIYPNPFSEYFEILSENKIHFEIINVLGQTLQQGTFQGLQVVHQLKEKGTYFLKLTHGQQTIVKKIVKN